MVLIIMFNKIIKTAVLISIFKQPIKNTGFDHHLQNTYSKHHGFDPITTYSLTTYKGTRHVFQGVCVPSQVPYKKTFGFDSTVRTRTKLYVGSRGPRCIT